MVDSNPSNAQLLAAGYLAKLSVILLDPISGNPTSAITVNQGETFSVRVTAEDLRLGGDDTNRGAQAAYLDLLFDRNKVTPISISFDPTYNALRRGDLNQPAPGSIDEAGATDALGDPPGQGEKTVFTVLLRATAPTSGQPVQIIGDPADLVEVTDVVLSPEEPGSLDPILGSPVALNDSQVYLQSSGNVIIFGAGEGFFVNRNNPLDVNQDNNVSPSDVLGVINTLNLTGPRSLIGQSFQGSSIPMGMVDVNMDSMLTPMDALAVINYLNVRSHTSVMQTAGAEGEASSGDASLLGLMSLEQGSGSTTSTPASVPVAPVQSSTRTTTAPSTPARLRLQRAVQARRSRQRSMLRLPTTCSPSWPTAGLN